MTKDVEPDAPPPHAPKWAVSQGLPPPEEGEGFRAYCRRLGIEDKQVERMLAGLDGLRLEVANARLGSHLFETMPEAFEAALRARKGYT